MSKPTRTRKLYAVGTVLERICNAITEAETNRNRKYRGKLAAIRRLAGKPIKDGGYDASILTCLEIMSELGEWRNSTDTLTDSESVMISTLALFASSIQMRNEHAYSANGTSIGAILGKIALRKRALNGGKPNASDDIMMRQIIKADDIHTIMYVMLRAIREYDGAIDYPVLGDDIYFLLTQHRDITLQRLSKDYIRVLSVKDEPSTDKEGN